MGRYEGQEGLNGFTYKDECADNAIAVLGGAEDVPLGAMAEIMELMEKEN